MSFLDRIRNSIPTWLSSPKSKTDALKIVGTVSAVFATYYVGKILKYRITEKQHEYNHYTNSYEVIEKMNIDLKGKVCIVTGSNNGIGKETAKQLYKAGCIVIMGCRNADRANKAINDIKQETESSEGELIFIKLDLSDLSTVDEFVQSFNDDETQKINGKLDYLVNNAGVMAFPEFGTTKNGIERQFGINHIGHFYLFNKLLPTIKRNKTRVVNVSSIAQLRSNPEVMNKMIDLKNERPSGPTEDVIKYDPWVYYAISKLSNLLFTRQINKLYYKSDGIVALCLHPGGIFTGLARNVDLNPLIWIMFYLKYRPYMKTIPQGASTTLRCVTIKEKDLNIAGNYEEMKLYFDNCREQNNHIQKDFRKWQHAEIDENLWKYSRKIIESLNEFQLNDD